MFLELETDTLSDVLNSNEKVIVQFSASWCGNCKIMKPKFKKMASENESVEFVVIDAEKNPVSRKLANVSNLPTFATYQNGVLVNQTQTNKAEVLAELLKEII
jgi:thiol-disulfide isomerase/thioredoxin